MLENFENIEFFDNDEHQKQSVLFQNKISSLQREITKNEIPIIIIFEGWNLSGKGATIANLISNLDPRGYNVCDAFFENVDQRHPFLFNFFSRLPQKGKITIFDRSWYQSVCNHATEENLEVDELKKRINLIKNFESQLINDGYLIIKFFLHISSKEQKQRMHFLEDNPATAWQIKKRHWKAQKKYPIFYDAFNNMLEETCTEDCEWNIINSTDINSANYNICKIVFEKMQKALESYDKKDKKLANYYGLETIKKMPYKSLSKVKLEDKKVKSDEYNRKIIVAQKRLWELQNILYKRKIPLVVAFEGWDAAGKGGTIKRLCHSLDPRKYKVIPIAAPTDVEKSYSYLWRFWMNIPQFGYIRIFDRTWYGRVLVEHIQSFCSDEDCNRAYDEINLFEKFLVDEGAIVEKFWLHIDKDEQLKRFKDRENDPEKSWKIVDEDWRNREKWDEYEKSVNQMLKRTSTKNAPWTIIESNNKKYARLKVLDHIIKSIEKRLEE